MAFHWPSREKQKPPKTPTHFKKHKSSKTTYIPKARDLLKYFTGFMWHFLEMLFSLLVLEQKEDEGDMGAEAGSAGQLADT